MFYQVFKVVLTIISYLGYQVFKVVLVEGVPVHSAEAENEYQQKLGG